MKVFVILQSFTDFKGGNATSFGVYTTKADAIKAMPNVILNALQYDSVEDWEEYNGSFDDYFDNPEHSNWSWDRDEEIIEFYIQEDELIEPELSIKEQILKLGRENLRKADDAGYGMYNFYITKELKNSFRNEDNYTGGMILQMYPIPDADCYGSIYLLAYYPLDENESNFDHDDIALYDMTEDEQKLILSAFKEFCGK